MGVYCITHGHAYEKANEVEMWENDIQDDFMASNNANWEVKSYGYDLYRCKNCFRRKRAYTGNSRFISY